MALKWTKTSGPDSCVMNPKPFSPLNHLTVPVVMDNPLHSWPDSNRSSYGRAARCRRGNCPQLGTTCALREQATTAAARSGRQRPCTVVGVPVPPAADGAARNEEPDEPEPASEARCLRGVEGVDDQRITR